MPRRLSATISTQWFLNCSLLNTLVLITSLSVLLPAVISWVRFNRIHPTFYPFVFCLWLGLLNEAISNIVAFGFHGSNAINSNIYVLLEGLLLLWQFHRWGNFSGKKGFFIFYLSLFLAIWIADNFFISKITSFSSYFRIAYSAVISLMSINYLNYVLVRERRNLLLNPSFLICAAFIIYYTYKVLGETFYLYGSSLSREFRINVFIIMMYINLITNCIFAFAVTWIPERQRFSLPS